MVTRTLAVLAAAVLAFGCRGHHDHDTPAKAAPGAAHAPRPPLPTHARPGLAAVAKGQVHPRKGGLVVPAPSGTPPAHTRGPLSAATLERLSQLTFPDFTARVDHVNDKALQVRHLTDDDPRIAVTINVAHCTDCLPMDLARWQARKPVLEQLLAPQLRDAPDTTFELGTTDLAGAPIIATYQVGYLMGAGVGAWSDAYALYFNDGKNQIRVVAEYKDDPPRSRDVMVQLAPRAELERAAKAFMDVYSHAWATPR